jgi:pimeloyl-ACP methyl ester carboxylesterase
MDLPAQRLTVNGLAMHVAELGEGPAVLLLHGFPDNHSVWRYQVAALADAGYRVIAPDLRGYGRSAAPPAVSAYSIDQLRADVIGLLDLLAIDKAVLVGHDWGAAVAWQVAIHAPERVERLVALSVGHPGAFLDAGLPQRLRSLYMVLFQARGLAERLLTFNDWFFMRQFTHDTEQIAGWRRDFADRRRVTAALNYYRANLKLAVRRHWPKVVVPVLGVWSSADPALTEAQMRGSGSYVAAPFRYARIDGAGHWLQLEAPAQVNALLLEFLGEGAPEPG